MGDRPLPRHHHTLPTKTPESGGVGGVRTFWVVGYGVSNLNPGQDIRDDRHTVHTKADTRSKATTETHARKPPQPSSTSLAPNHTAPVAKPQTASPHPSRHVTKP